MLSPLSKIRPTTVEGKRQRPIWLVDSKTADFDEHCPSNWEVEYGRLVLTNRLSCSLLDVDLCCVIQDQVHEFIKALAETKRKRERGTSVCWKEKSRWRLGQPISRNASRKQYPLLTEKTFKSPCAFLSSWNCLWNSSLQWSGPRYGCPTARITKSAQWISNSSANSNKGGCWVTQASKDTVRWIQLVLLCLPVADTWRSGSNG